MVEELRVGSVPHVHGVHRGFAAKGGLGQIFVVEQAIAEQGLFKVFAAHETMSLQDVRDATIDTRLQSNHRDTPEMTAVREAQDSHGGRDARAPLALLRETLGARASRPLRGTSKMTEIPIRRTCVSTAYRAQPGIKQGGYGSSPYFGSRSAKKVWIRRTEDSKGRNTVGSPAIEDKGRFCGLCLPFPVFGQNL
jgi:hypothetical protein